MSDVAFELRLARAARALADEAIRPVDAAAIAESAMRAVGGTDALAPRSVSRRGPWLVLAAAALATVVAVSASLLLSRVPPVPLATPSPSANASTSSGPAASPSPTPPPVGIPERPSLRGTWIADTPTGLTFDGTRPRGRIALNIDEPMVTVDVVDAATGLFQSTLGTVSDGEVRLTSDSSGLTSPRAVTLDGTTLATCAAGDEGRYRTASTREGLLLTLTLVDDPCPARAAVLARTWTRSNSVPNGGGIGVVDGFDPLFAVEMPEGHYTVDRDVDSRTLHQGLPEFQFISAKNPQGFRDPCDRSNGRYEIAPGADPVVAYFRQLAGFTVDSTAEVTVDGHRAIRLVVHADADAKCPNDQLWEWQPKAVTGDFGWFLGPGITDSLFIVEHPKGTLLFEVLPAPNPIEDQVIGSIHFLDELPTTP
jgi:hypothetical protein